MIGRAVGIFCLCAVAGVYIHYGGPSMRNDVVHAGGELRRLASGAAEDGKAFVRSLLQSKEKKVTQNPEDGGIIIIPLPGGGSTEMYVDPIPPWTPEGWNKPVKSTTAPLKDATMVVQTETDESGSTKWTLPIMQPKPSTAPLKDATMVVQTETDESGSTKWTLPIMQPKPSTAERSLRAAASYGEVPADEALDLGAVPAPFIADAVRIIDAYAAGVEAASRSAAAGVAVYDATGVGSKKKTAAGFGGGSVSAAAAGPKPLEMVKRANASSAMPSVSKLIAGLKEAALAAQNNEAAARKEKEDGATRVRALRSGLARGCVVENDNPKLQRALKEVPRISCFRTIRSKAPAAE